MEATMVLQATLTMALTGELVDCKVVVRQH